MGRRLCLLIAMFLLVSACAGGSAVASEASLTPPVPGRIMLAFGDAYASGDRQLKHGGLDLEASAGDAVLAATSGQVTFAGAVPADGGGRAFAVTIQTPDARKVTVSPLTSVDVSVGQAVLAGDELGALSSSGDASVATSHVHLSVRVGERYVDPAPMLPAAVVSDSGADANAGSAATEESNAGASGAVASGVDGAGAHGRAAAVGAATSGAIGASDGLGATHAGQVATTYAAGTTVVDGGVVQRQLAPLRTRVGSAYRRAITQMRGSALAPAQPFAAGSGRAFGANITAPQALAASAPVPAAPAIPLAGMLGAAASLGTGAVAVARIRRQYARGVV